VATTAESIEDAIAWMARFARMAARRALMGAALIVLFVAAVLWTTRDVVSDCSDVTVAQKERVTLLRDGSASDGFGPTSDGACLAGEFIAPLDGIEGDIESMTNSLEERGFVQVAEFIPLFDNSWWRCFRHDGQEWRDLDVRIRADRLGVVSNVEILAPEKGRPCEEFPGVGER
jgi:hypothetical protein